MPENGFNPKIVGFLCNWCAYSGADLAGVSRIQSSPSLRPIRVMCSGRIDPGFVFTALNSGADGVLLAGCHPGDCHYSEGNYFTRRRGLLLRKLLEYVGIEPERFQVRWVSASEGAKFADTVEQVTNQIKELGPRRPQRIT